MVARWREFRDNFAAGGEFYFSSFSHSALPRFLSEDYKRASWPPSICSWRIVLTNRNNYSTRRGGCICRGLEGSKRVLPPLRTTENGFLSCLRRRIKVVSLIVDPYHQGDPENSGLCRVFFVAAWDNFIFPQSPKIGKILFIRKEKERERDRRTNNEAAYPISVKTIDLVALTRSYPR